MTFLLSHVNFLLEITDHAQFKYVHREMELMLTTGYSYYSSWLFQVFYDFCIFITQTLEKTAVSSQTSLFQAVSHQQLAGITLVAIVQRLWKSSPRRVVTHPYKLQETSDQQLQALPRSRLPSLPPDVGQNSIFGLRYKLQIDYSSKRIRWQMYNIMSL